MPKDITESMTRELARTVFVLPRPKLGKLIWMKPR